MNGPVTEKTFPVQNAWLLKSSLGPLIGACIYGFIYFSLAGAGDTETSLYFYILFAYVPFNLLYSVLSRNAFHYMLDDTILTVHQGILSKQQRNVPYGVIQNVIVKQDIFDRLFGLASLHIDNASQNGETTTGSVTVFGLPLGTRNTQAESVGFKGNRISMPGLTKQDADSLKALIMQKMKENPVEDGQSGL